MIGIQVRKHKLTVYHSVYTVVLNEKLRDFNLIYFYTFPPK